MYLNILFLVIASLILMVLTILVIPNVILSNTVKRAQKKYNVSAVFVCQSWAIKNNLASIDGVQYKVLDLESVNILFSGLAYYLCYTNNKELFLLSVAKEVPWADDFFATYAYVDNPWHRDQKGYYIIKTEKDFVRLNGFAVNETLSALGILEADSNRQYILSKSLEIKI